MSEVQPLAGIELQDFEPMVRRVVSTDPATFIRFRRDEHSIAGFIQLPYDVIAGRTLNRAAATAPVAPSGLSSPVVPAGQGVLAAAGAGRQISVDVTYAAEDFLGWLAGEIHDIGRRDAHWLSPLPPRDRWQRLELVPDTVIRELIRAGAAVARDVSERAGQQSLLASPVLTVAAADPVHVPLRALTALTKLGFLPRDSQAAVDVAPGWLRVAAAYGSTFITTSSGLLTLGLG